MKEYSNQTIFIGIDVHKKSYSISAIHNGTLIKKATIVADPDILLSFLYKNFNNAQLETAYEAGFSGFYLHRYLVGNGINNIVVHPASIEIASRERVKNDRRDSLKIATQLSAGRLKSVYIPNCAREDFRTISRLRNSFVKDRTKKGVQLKCVLHRLGKIPYSETTFTSKKWIEKVLKIFPGLAVENNPAAIKLIPNSYALGVTEGWRGDIIYFVATDKDGNISRVDVRDPSLLNWTAVPFAVKGNIVPDFPLINKSFNLSYSGNDV